MAAITVKIAGKITKIIWYFVAVMTISVDDKPRDRMLLVMGKKVMSWRI